MDHLHTLNQIVEKAKEYNFKIYLAFIDYTKAFDSLKHSFLFQSLKKKGINPTYLKILKYIYNRGKARIRLEKKGPLFDIGRGVRQGDPLSPVLFNTCLEELFNNLDWQNSGLRVNGRYLNNLRFADDVVLIAKSKEELKYMIEDLREKSIEAGLTINFEKTKLMTNDKDCTGDIKLDDRVIGWVESFEYLGQTIAFQNGQQKEINKRITMAWKKFWSLKHILKNREIPIGLKMKVFTGCVIPCLTYGCQSWSLTKKQYKQLETTQFAMERSILYIKRQDRIRNAYIRERTQLKNVTEIIKGIKWKWAGHVCRMTDDRWTKRVTEWYPRDLTRLRGRKHIRWRDELVKFAGPLWTRKCLCRQEWFELGEAFVQ